MHFEIPTGLRNDNKLNPLAPYAMLVFDSSTDTCQFQISDGTPITMLHIALSLNDTCDALTHVPFILRSQQ